MLGAKKFTVGTARPNVVVGSVAGSDNLDVILLDVAGSYTNGL